ncbi:WhiB family transcriptional regulator [Streptomyces sp. NPDC048241]|uniref:WhiB family transcriptional regulator n=1 Tax=Streptomyces sp. NPDC048241 TaxID=3365521 RepID=UPI003715ACB3
MKRSTHHMPNTPSTDDWRARAACRSEDPELFFPKGEVGWKTNVDKAKKVCRRCPVHRECLQLALDNGLDDGVFGGLSDKERRVLIRRRTNNAA